MKLSKIKVRSGDRLGTTDPYGPHVEHIAWECPERMTSGNASFLVLGVSGRSSLESCRPALDRWTRDRRPHQALPR